MKRRMLAAALAMAGILGTIGTALGEEAGSCSLEVAGAPVTVASASSVAASASAAAAPSAPAPDAQPSSAAPVAAPTAASAVARSEPTSPPGSCGAPEKVDGNHQLTPVASAGVSEPASAVEASPPPRPAKPVEAVVPEKNEVARASAPPAESKPAKAPARPRAAARTSTPRAKANDQAALAWWSPKVGDALNLVYAGEASFSSAIVLLFDGAFDDSALANRVIHVTSDAGAPVSGQWVVATNKRMLLFKAPPGRYRVKVGEGLVDSAGRKIVAAQGGPVNVATR